MNHHLFHFCSMCAAAVLMLPHALRLSKIPWPWPGPRDPGGIWLWLPLIAFVPMLLATIGTLAGTFRERSRRGPIHRSLRVLRWTSILIVTASVALIAWAEIAQWMWELRGSPTAMGNLEMLGPAAAFFLGWLGFGIAGGIDVLVVAGIARIPRPSGP